MKKIWIIGVVAVALVAVLAFGYQSWAYAQDDQPVCSYCGGGEWMGGRNGYHGQMYGEGAGWMHDYIFPAMAEALGMTTEELQAAHDAGETLWQIAQSRGLTVEEFQAIMLEARAQSLQQMVADGVISQEQADWMLEHMGGGRFGQGNQGCGMYGGYSPNGSGPGGRGGGRWSNRP